MNYFIQSEGEAHGPLTADQIRLRLAERGLNATDLVRREDTTEWAPLWSLDEFADAVLLLPSQNNPMAVASLLLGVASLPMLLLSAWKSLPLFLLTAIPAIVFGHWAVKKIGSSFHHVKGYRAAKIGLWLGYLMAFAVPVAAALTIPTFSKIAERGPQTKAINNCRQIITTLRLYSSDQTGSYPDSGMPLVNTSNEAFHRLFVEGQADNEVIFGCPLSPYNPDGDIGKEPDYLEALKPQENHWAMTRGLSDSDTGSYPLVYENPSEASWPPRWNSKFKDVPKPGRIWKSGKIVIGMNDSSVALMPIEPPKGSSTGATPLLTAKDLFPMDDHKPKLSVLQVAH